MNQNEVNPWTPDDVPDECIIRYDGSECKLLAWNMEGVVFISGAGIIKKMSYEQLAYCKYKYHYMVPTGWRMEKVATTWEWCRK